MIAHEQFMQRCLALAAQGRGLVGNGAMVGAVLVRNGAVIAEGYHSGYGFAHAERDLLQKFDQQIDSSDVLYVNLEPCCHQGKTPPCTDMLISRGVRTVVVGMADPDMRMAGKGITQLREHGITVTGPVLPEQCARLNRGFVSLRTVGRPWITLKKAQRRDGTIEGKITSHEQDVWSHTMLRGKHDAILVGAQTVRTDNPILNNRFDQNKKVDQKIPYRIVLHKDCDLDIQSTIFTDTDRDRTIIVVSDDASRDQVFALENAGVRLLRVPCEADGQFVWTALFDALCTPRDAFTGITSILVEGGRRTWQSFMQAGMVDEEVIVVRN